MLLNAVAYVVLWYISQSSLFIGRSLGWGGGASITGGLLGKNDCPYLCDFLICHLLSVFFDDHVLAIKLCHRYKGIILRWYT